MCPQVLARPPHLIPGIELFSLDFTLSSALVCRLLVVSYAGEQQAPRILTSSLLPSPFDSVHKVSSWSGSRTLSDLCNTRSLPSPYISSDSFSLGPIASLLVYETVAYA